MWSLPDINKLNAHAAAGAQQLRTEAARKLKPDCEIPGCSHRAEQSTLWFDIFSDDPKGVIHTCERHSWEEHPGFFWCENCERVMVENYTWERYRVQLHGDVLCLRCAANRCFGLAQSWVNPTAVRRVVLERGDGPVFERQSGVLNVALCPHVLAVGQPPPDGIRLSGSAEFDICGGSQISGENLMEVIGRLDEPFCPVLDGAYQFAVSIGIYVRCLEKGET